jgi:hypothetical protein
VGHRDAVDGQDLVLLGVRGPQAGAGGFRERGFLHDAFAEDCRRLTFSMSALCVRIGGRRVRIYL